MMKVSQEVDRKIAILESEIATTCIFSFFHEITADFTSV